MAKRVTKKREPQTGQGKKTKVMCPRCGEYYLINLYAQIRDPETKKLELVKKALFCDGCKYVELIK